MRSFEVMRSALQGLGLAALMIATPVGNAVAWERYDGYGSGGGYGFGGEAIGGDYIGAPLTRFPRPNELVPSAWGYGTYGVPTVTGIRQAPTAAPTLTVIDVPAPPPRRQGTAARMSSRNAEKRLASSAQAAEYGRAGVRVISITVPRR